MNLTQILVLIAMVLIGVIVVWVLFRNEKIKTAIFTILLAIFISANVAFVMGYANAMPESEQHGLLDLNGFDITNVQTYDNITGTQLTWDGSRLQYVWESWQDVFVSGFNRTINTAGYWSNTIEQTANNAFALAESATNDILTLTGLIETTQADIVSLNASVLALETNESLTQAQIDAINATLSNYADLGEFNTLSDLVNTIQAQADALGVDLTDLSTATQAQIDAINTALAGFATVGEFTALSDLVNTIQAQADALGVDLTDLSTATQAQIDALQAQIDALSVGGLTQAQIDAVLNDFVNFSNLATSIYYNAGTNDISRMTSSQASSYYTWAEAIKFNAQNIVNMGDALSWALDTTRAQATLIADLQAQIDAITGV